MIVSMVNPGALFVSDFVQDRSIGDFSSVDVDLISHSPSSSPATLLLKLRGEFLSRNVLFFLKYRIDRSRDTHVPLLPQLTPFSWEAAGFDFKETVLEFRLENSRI